MVLFQFYLLLRSLQLWAFERFLFFAPRVGMRDAGNPRANCWGAAGSLKRRPSITNFRDLIRTPHPDVVSMVDFILYYLILYEIPNLFVFIGFCKQVG